MRFAYFNMFRWLQRMLPGRRQLLDESTTPAKVPAKTAAPPRQRIVVAGDDDRAQLVQRFMDLGRIAILMRTQIASTLDSTHLAVVREEFQQVMALLAAGEVILLPWTIDDAESALAKLPRTREAVSSFYMDRLPVTNRQFREFVGDGAYGQPSMWDASIWPRVAEFTDRTGMAGPRYWTKGSFPEGEEDSPVVGVTWFEADAYARWAGKRLPTDAEWLLAAAGPSVTTEGEIVQRRFPWGETLDQQRANLGSTGLGRPNAVTEFTEGSSALGIAQLIGNVWEWTASDLTVISYGKNVRFEAPLKSLRGSAFDTYFDSQATCQFQSGDTALARRHNVGFRCALSARDIVQPGSAA